MSLQAIDWILFICGAILFATGGWGLRTPERSHINYYGRRSSYTDITPLGYFIAIIGGLLLAAWLFLVIYGPQIPYFMAHP
jgi:hypothetical protein